MPLSGQEENPWLLHQFVQITVHQIGGVGLLWQAQESDELILLNFEAVAFVEPIICEGFVGLDVHSFLQLYIDEERSNVIKDQNVIRQIAKLIGEIKGIADGIFIQGELFQLFLKPLGKFVILSPCSIGSVSV